MNYKILFLLNFVSSFSFAQDILNERLKIIPFIDFNASMGIDAKQLEQYKNNKELFSRFQLLSLIYEKNNISKITPSINPKIPKVIHQIWLGKSPMPYKQIRDKWIAMHPNWKYKLWNDRNIKQLFPLINQKYFNQTKNLGEKADILRYEILYRFGGFYVDVDYECLHSFDILAHSYNFIVGIEPIDMSPLYIGNSIIGSSPNHPILQCCIDTVKKYRNLKTVPDRTGPAHLTKALSKVGYLSNTIAFPTTYLYPWNSIIYKKMKRFDRVEKLNISDYTKKESLGFHYWSGSWK